MNIITTINDINDIINNDIVNYLNDNKQTKKKLIAIYRSYYKENKISNKDFNFFEHFNYSLTIKYDNNIDILNFLIFLDKIRNKFLNILLDQFIDIYICKKSNKLLCEYQNVGTIGYKSDFDITFKTKNNNIDIIILIFNVLNIYVKTINNRIFLNNIFDINFYFSEWLDFDNNSFCSIELCNNFTILSFDNLNELLDNQLYWSRIRKLNINPNISPLYINIHKEYNSLIPFVNNTTNFEYYIDNYNENIIELLKIKNKLLLSIKQKNNIQKNIINYYDTNSILLYLSNEAYYSFGAYLHIVSLLQNNINYNTTKIFKNENILKLDIEILKKIFIMSFNENFGFLIKLGFNNNILLNSKYIKYIYRCFNAYSLYLLLDNFNIEEIKSNIFSINYKNILDLIKDKNKLYLNIILITIFNKYSFIKKEYYSDFFINPNDNKKTSNSYKIIDYDSKKSSKQIKEISSTLIIEILELLYNILN